MHVNVKTWSELSRSFFWFLNPKCCSLKLLSEKMIIPSNIHRVRGLLHLTKAVKFQKWSLMGISNFSRRCVIKISSVPKSGTLCAILKQTDNTSLRFIHCTSCLAVTNTSSHYQKNDSSQPNEYDFKSDPDISSWMSDMSSDFKHEKTLNSDTEKSFSDDSGNSSDVESSASDGSSSDSEDSDTESPSIVKSSEVEDIDYEEFFLEEEAIRHEDLIEELPIPIELKKGEKGVFDVEEVVKVLEEENGQDICVITVPPDINYTDNLIIVTGKSFRHLLGMAELMRWIYKRKRGDRDPVTVRIEGLQSKDWLAIDLGNIVLHLMMEKVRKKYDIESLWLLGPENDPQNQEFEQNPYVLNPQMENLESLKSKQQYSESVGQKDNQPEFYGMQSVAGWHKEVQDHPRPKDLTRGSKKPDDPHTKEY